jgi:hypothetical protein
MRFPFVAVIAVAVVAGVTPPTPPNPAKPLVVEPAQFTNLPRGWRAFDHDFGLLTAAPGRLKSGLAVAARGWRPMATVLLDRGQARRRSARVWAYRLLARR